MIKSDEVTKESTFEKIKNVLSINLMPIWAVVLPWPIAEGQYKSTALFHLKNADLQTVTQPFRPQFAMPEKSASGLYWNCAPTISLVENSASQSAYALGHFTIMSFH